MFDLLAEKVAGLEKDLKDLKRKVKKKDGANKNISSIIDNVMEAVESNKELII